MHSEILAILAATCIAFSSLLISELRGRVGVLRLARWQMVSALVMTAAVSVAMGGWRTLEAWQVGMLAASSAAGIVIASTTYFAAIYAAGPRVTALLFSLTSPFALALGYIALGETISLRQGAGVVLVLSGILLAVGLARENSSAAMPEVAALPGASAGVPWRGIVLGVITALGQALGSLLARPVMAAGAEPFTAMAVRSGLAAAFFIALAVVPMTAVQPPYRFSGRAFGIGIASSFIGTGLGMSLLMAALSNGNVGIVSTLSSMTPVLVLPMVWMRTGAAPLRNAWIGAILAVAGTALISM